MNRKKRRFLARSAAVMLSASMLFAATGCTNTETEDGDQLVTLIVKSKDDYWQTLKKGAKDACEEMGYDLNILEPEYENNYNQQKQFIQQAIDNGSKAIILAPASSTELKDALDAAVTAGVPIIAVETDVEFEAKETVIATDQASAGGIAARATIKAAPLGGKLGIISHNQDSLISIGRIESYLENISYIDLTLAPEEGEDAPEAIEPTEGTGSGPQFSLIAKRFCDSNIDIAKLNAKEMIENNPDLKVIFCTDQASTVGACRGVQEAGMSGKITVIGFEANDELVEYIKDGTLSGSVLQNKYNMGYLGVRYADKLLEGEDIPPSIDTGVCFVTKDNLEDPDVQLLLNPADN